MMDFMELAKRRFSVLDYRQEPVAEDAVRQILQAGLAAPTACNFQPQRIKVIRTEEERQKQNAEIPGKNG